MSLILSFIKSKILKILPYFGIVIGFLFFYIKGKKKSKEEAVKESIEYLKNNYRKRDEIAEKKEIIHAKFADISNNPDSTSRDHELSELLSSDPFKDTETSRPKN